MNYSLYEEFISSVEHKTNIHTNTPIKLLDFYLFKIAFQVNSKLIVQLCEKKDTMSKTSTAVSMRYSCFHAKRWSKNV